MCPVASPAHITSTGQQVPSGPCWGGWHQLVRVDSAPLSPALCPLPLLGCQGETERVGCTYTTEADQPHKNILSPRRQLGTHHRPASYTFAEWLRTPSLDSRWRRAFLCRGVLRDSSSAGRKEDAVPAGAGGSLQVQSCSSPGPWRGGRGGRQPGGSECRPPAC